ncbi:serine/threonine-protein kinase [Gilvimarinus chinensis]|uniref:serine/threonine-protein kinase n=1 Tax=Gilvimarinus chinensis TaxID=396005 RepID=UPI00035EE9A0|nr:serine/threonine-protein kinase [Gilvimarinus chinensis]
MEIPGYKIIDTLGEGGMATVYLAIQESFEREVALKVMSPQLSKDPSFGERFIREARIVSRLMHPNIVTVYDVGVHDGHHYLSMEYIPGEDLKAQRYDLPLGNALAVIKDVARALDYAGRKGYIHRDVKPENIMLHADDGRAVLMDFGIARATDVASGMTQTGTTMGTPHYMSPEQAKGAQLSPCSDIYSLGVVLFQLLCGHVPFDADSPVAVGIMHVSEPVPRLPEHLAAFQPIIDKVLAKKPVQRYQNGSELIVDLDAIDAKEVEQIAAQMVTQPLPEEVDVTATTVGSAKFQAAQLDTKAVAQATGDNEEGIASGSSFSVSHADSIGRADTTIGTSGNKSRGGQMVIIALILLSVVAGFYWQQIRPTTTAVIAPEPPAITVSSDSSVSSESQSAVSVSSLQSTAVASASSSLDSVSQAQPVVPALDGVADTEKSPPNFDPELDTRLLQAQLYLDQGAVDEPVGANALEMYQRILQRWPDNRIAAEGIERISARYQRRARAALESDDLALATKALERAQEISPDSPDTQALVAQLESAQKSRARQLQLTLTRATRQLAADKLIAPAGDNAFDTYQEILAQYPTSTEAIEGLVNVEQGLLGRIDSMIRGGALEEASLQLASARDHYPQSQALLARRLELDQLVESQQPKVSNLKVSAVAFNTLDQAQPEVVTPDRVIYLGFSYANFNGKDASVIQAVLMDGARSVQIAQVPVIVSGSSGTTFFRIERPVSGFSEGSYHVDLLLDGVRLHSVAFKVGQ